MLFYGPQAKDDDDSFGICGTDIQAFFSENISGDELTLLGHWSGSYTYEFNVNGDDLVSFDLISHEPTGQFEAKGTDTVGEFEVMGHIKNDRVAFIKQYLRPEDCPPLKWAYQGRLTNDSHEIRGIWGPPPDSDELEWMLGHLARPLDRSVEVDEADVCRDQSLPQTDEGEDASQTYVLFPMGSYVSQVAHP